MRSGAKAGIVGGVFLAMAGTAAYGGYNVLTGLTGEGSGGAAGGNEPVVSKADPGDPLSGKDVTGTAEAFLDAWAEGDADAAAALTNNEDAARIALAGYRNEAHVSEVELTPGARAGAEVPFTVRAEVVHGGRSTTWSYTSALTVVRGLTTGKPLVDWFPSVIHPKLGKGQLLKTGGPSAPELIATDRDGEELTAEEYPSLGPVLNQLRERYADEAEGGRAGVAVWIDGSATGAPDQTLLTLVKGRPARLETTLDAQVQAAAEQAVASRPDASLVAVEPSTGNVLAVANHRGDQFNAAFEGRRAPGSTMKIITAAMLMDNGLAGENGPAECPAEASWYGKVFTNQDGFSMGTTTYASAFARSCNTAFIKPVKQLDERDIADTALGDTAGTYFGIGREWHTGITSFDGSVPVSSQAETAASYIGQGRVEMNPLTVASVTATVQSGAFRQPVLVAPSLLDGGRAQAQPLPQGTAEQLRSMMHTTATASYGTASGVMAGVPGPMGAKTGSAETGSGQPDSWFTGYSGDLAVAAVVEHGGHGADAAGPIVRTVLLAGN